MASSFLSSQRPRRTAPNSLIPAAALVLFGLGCRIDVYHHISIERSQEAPQSTVSDETADPGDLAAESAQEALYGLFEAIGETPPEP